MGVNRTAKTRRAGRGLACAALAGLTLTLAVAPALGQPLPYAGIAATADAQARLGVRTAVLTRQTRTGQIDAFAKVLDPGPLAALETDLEAAQAAAAASAAEAKRAQALNAAGGGVAKKDAEAAASQAKSDAAHLALLRQRIGLEWGPGLARLTDAGRRALIAELARGEAALVHVDTPNNDGQADARSVEIDVGSGSAHGLVLGAARAAEPRLQSSGLIAVVRGRSAVLLSTGLIQSAHINTKASAPGVVIPREAVIRFEGSDWAYVRRTGVAFERRRIDNPLPEAAGLFVTGGFRPGEAVVVQGATELFGMEQSQATRAR